MITGTEIKELQAAADKEFGNKLKEITKADYLGMLVELDMHSSFTSSFNFSERGLAIIQSALAKYADVSYPK